jgi:hypothetical protein
MPEWLAVLGLGLCLCGALLLGIGYCIQQREELQRKTDHDG